MVSLMHVHMHKYTFMYTYSALSIMSIIGGLVEERNVFACTIQMTFMC